MEYIPQIKKRLSLLEDQLQNIQAKPKISEIETTADTLSKLKTLNLSGNGGNTKTSNHSNEYQEEKRKQDSELDTLSEQVLQLRCLLDFIQTEPDLQRLLNLRAKVEAGDLETIRFPDIWLLFKPGDLIVSRVSNHWQLRKVYSTTGAQVQKSVRQEKIEHNGKRAWVGEMIEVEEDETEKYLRQSKFGIGSWTPLKVDCYTLGVVEDELRTVDSLCKIKPFQGDMKISDLPIYPVRFHPDSVGLLTRMEERGLKFLMSLGHKIYRGLSARIPSNEPLAVHEVDGDVYVDSRREIIETSHGSILLASRIEVTESYEEVCNSIRMLSGNEVDTRRSEEFMSEGRIKIDLEEAKKSKDFLILLPWVVYAYVFRLRRWGKFEEAAILFMRADEETLLGADTFNVC